MFVLTGIPVGRVRYVVVRPAPRRFLGDVTQADLFKIGTEMTPTSMLQKMAFDCAANPSAHCITALNDALSTPYGLQSDPGHFYKGWPPVAVSAVVTPASPPPALPSPASLPAPAPPPAASVPAAGFVPPTNEAIQPGPTPGVVPTAVIQAPALPSSLDISGSLSSLPSWAWIAAAGAGALLVFGGGHKRRRRHY